MRTSGLLSILLFLLTHAGISQPVTIRIRMNGPDDSTGKASFKVIIKNNSFQKYYVQDTTILQKYAASNHSLITRIDKRATECMIFFRKQAVCPE
ncbi:hypothetical protein [Paraflavitalea speifideaquila]|uniref:hypothetical protein n=1 Tax=Paraflavitalea speifideaquila TaxID=3076558 RepID=UPI0028EAC418|nr:hypothetical protein [Paraflavitalea speifideiaquila]